MAREAPARWKCPQCGYTEASIDDLPENDFFRPWHVMHGRAGVRSYVASLGEEAHEWLLALFVDEQLRLLAVDTVAQGDVSSCEVPKWHLISRAKALGAAAFILVHNHPSGDPAPSDSDIRITSQLARISRELDVPLIDHLIIAGDEMKSVGHW